MEKGALVRRRFLKLAAATAVAALAVAGCGGDSDSPTPAQPAPSAGPAGGELVVGRILPETGLLSTLSPAMVVAVDLAVEDIKAAGG